MKQRDFEKTYEETWKQLERWLDTPDTGDVDPDIVPGLYRKVCHHLALTRTRQYSPALEDRLNRLALRGHRALYAARVSTFGNLWRLFGSTFPRSVRQNAWVVLVSAILFYGPFAAMVGAIAINPSLAYSVMSADQLDQIEAMYSDVENDSSRDSTTDLMMFGHYIYNNIGIGFMTFAAGVVLGLGSVFVLVSNGLFIGAVFGYLTHAGLGHVLYPFVAGHGAFELNAIVLAGACGLRLGMSLVAPGRRRRSDALRHTASDTMPMVYGFTAMLLIAAFIEAFWSSTSWSPPTVKYTVAALLWVGVALYFVFAGRRDAA
ncbi:MAG: stage II sporulation protein M [Pseudomonadota bacterium]